MDRFEAMRVFIRVLERRSFTRAAEDLGLPRSTVTDAIKDKINRAAAPSVEKLLQNPIYLDYARYAKHKGKLVMQA